MSGTEVPESGSPAKEGTDIYAYLTAFDAGTGVGTYDKVDAFFGEDAVRACAEDGETSTANDRCTGYYYRNVNPKTRQIAVAPDAAIRTLRGADPVTGNAMSLATAVRDSGGRQLFTMRVEDNQAVAVTAVYLP